MAPAPILYITYDGLLEPLGQSQVVAYLEQLAATYPIVIMSFEKEADRGKTAEIRGMKDRLARVGITWVPLAYHKSPSALATSYDIAVGSAMAIRLARRHGARIVHARSYVPALMALAVKRVCGARFVFDMRGLWADERVDGGLWPRDGRLYRAAKACEDRFLRAADHVVTLTKASTHELARFPALVEHPVPMSVIPTCANLDLFRPQGQPDQSFTLGYVGQFGTWYMLDELMRLFGALRAHRPDARLLVVNRAEHTAIRDAAARAGIPDACLELGGAPHHDVPKLIGRMHASTALIAPVYSKIASAPTKLAEYLGCGVPCVGSAVGDVAEILEEELVGVVLRTFDAAACAQAAESLLDLLKDPGLRARCVDTARRRFSLDEGVAAYRAIYERLSAA